MFIILCSEKSRCISISTSEKLVETILLIFVRITAVTFFQLSRVFVPFRFTEFSKTVSPRCCHVVRKFKSENQIPSVSKQQNQTQQTLDADRELQMFLSCKQQLYHRPISLFGTPACSHETRKREHFYEAEGRRL